MSTYFHIYAIQNKSLPSIQNKTRLNTFIFQSACESINNLPENTYFFKMLVMNFEVHLQQISKEGIWSWSRRKLSSHPL